MFGHGHDIWLGMGTKRHQVVQALHALSSGTSRSAAKRLFDPVPDRFFGSIKRLLEADLSHFQGNAPGLAGQEMAFFASPPKGRGIDADYPPDKVFNLAVAKELINLGCKPSEAIKLIYDISSSLEDAFRRATKARSTSGRTSETNWDHDGSNKSLTEKRNASKIFLIVRRIEVTGELAEKLGGSAIIGEYLYDAEICADSDTVSDYLASELRDGLFGAFVIELSELAQRIVELLRVEFRRERGRKKED